jgi:hypothetical protein
MDSGDDMGVDWRISMHGLGLLSPRVIGDPHGPSASGGEITGSLFRVGIVPVIDRAQGA